MTLPDTASRPGTDALSILLVEDDAAQAERLRDQLVALGHHVDILAEARPVAQRIAERPFDILLLDRMLPQTDGMTLLKWLRAEGIGLPVILLSALGRTADRVAGLEAGADDYLAKPFAIEELHARMRAVLRRRAPAGTAPDRSTLTAGDITVSPARHSATRAGRPIELQKTELKLLTELVRDAGAVLTRSMLLARVWGYDFEPTTNIVDVYIRRLRQRLEMPGLPDPIVTIRGIGYMIRS